MIPSWVCLLFCSVELILARAEWWHGGLHDTPAPQEPDVAERAAAKAEWDAKRGVITSCGITAQSAKESKQPPLSTFAKPSLHLFSVVSCLSDRVFAEVVILAVAKSGPVMFAAGARAILEAACGDQAELVLVGDEVHEFEHRDPHSPPIALPHDTSRVLLVFFCFQRSHFWENIVDGADLMKYMQSPRLPGTHVI